MHRLNIFLSCFGHSGWAGHFLLLFWAPNPNPSGIYIRQFGMQFNNYSMICTISSVIKPDEDTLASYYVTCYFFLIDGTVICVTVSTIWRDLQDDEDSM